MVKALNLRNSFSLAWCGVIVSTITEKLRETGGSRIENTSLAKSRSVTIVKEDKTITSTEL